MSTHARLSPSSASRWTSCPGSVAAQAGRPDTSGDAAELGTHAHAALEHCLQGSIDENGLWVMQEVDMDPMTQVGGWFHDRDLEPEIAAAVKVAWDYVKQICRTYPDTIVYPEVQVDPGHFLQRDDMTGTSDIILWNPTTQTLEVIDYKNGTHWVDAENNLQMLIYLLGSMAMVLPNAWAAVMRTTIVQPRAGGELVRSHDYTIDTVRQYMTWFVQRAAATDDPQAPRIPSEDACHWCKAKGDCPERTEMALDTARTVFKPIMLGEEVDQGFDESKVPGLHPDTVRLILESKSFILSVYKDVEAHAIAQLKDGKPVPGFKLVAGRNKREWTLEESALIERLKNTGTLTKKKLTQHEYLNMRPVSPAAAEKVIKPLVSAKTWSSLKELIKTSPGSPVLAPANSSKPAISNAADVFEKVETVPDFLT